MFEVFNAVLANIKLLNLPDWIASLMPDWNKIA